MWPGCHCQQRSQNWMKDMGRVTHLHIDLLQWHHRQHHPRWSWQPRCHPHIRGQCQRRDPRSEGHWLRPASACLSPCPAPAASLPWPPSPAASQAAVRFDQVTSARCMRRAPIGSTLMQDNAMHVKFACAAAQAEAAVPHLRCGGCSTHHASVSMT